MVWWETQHCCYVTTANVCNCETCQ